MSAVQNPRPAYAFFAATAVCAAVSASGSRAADPPFRRTLVSASENLNLLEWKTSSAQVAPQSPRPWSVEKKRLYGGKQEGVDLLILDNGRLKITLIPTRGMGILSVEDSGLRHGWESPVKEVVHPSFVNLQSRGGLGWLDGFNEFMCRCGLENNGGPGPDKFINNVGDEASMDLTLHGKIANIPAREVEFVAEREAPYRLYVRSRVDERMFYGPQLEMRTELITEPGSGTFQLADTVTNRGARPQEFQMLYHTNFGKPLLDAGSRFSAPAERITPMNAHAAKGVGEALEYPGPTLGAIESVYLFRLKGDARGRTRCLLKNKAGDRGFAMGWSLKELPYLTLWKNPAAVADGYVTGIEPGTNYPFNRRIERKFGRVPKLAPGENYRMTIDFASLTGSTEIQRQEQEIARLQGNTKPVVDAEPPKVE